MPEGPRYKRQNSWMSKPPMPRTSRALVLLNIQTSLCFHKGHDFSSIFVLCRNIFPLFDSLQSSCDGKSLWHWTQSTLSKFLNFLKLTLWWWWWWWCWWFGDGLYIHVSQAKFFINFMRVSKITNWQWRFLINILTLGMKYLAHFSLFTCKYFKLVENGELPAL